MTMPELTIRDEEITALTPRAELIAVVRVAAIVLVTVSVYLFVPALASTRGDGAPGAGRAAKNLLPFQALIQGHDAVDQKMFRSLQVALLEAQNIRASEGKWPDVQAMAEQGVDPFTVDPTNKGARYSWRTLRNGLTTDYLGIPDAEGAPAWLMVVQEPDPAAPPEVYSDDEEHARLLDGTVIHVGIWRHVNGNRVPASAVRLPQAEGWSQVFAVSPSGNH